MYFLAGGRGVFFGSIRESRFMNESWFSDGTEDGTHLLHEIPGQWRGGSPKPIAIVNHTLLTAAGSGEFSTLWAADESGGQPFSLATVNAVGSDWRATLVTLGGVAYFAGTVENSPRVTDDEHGLWRSDDSLSS